jgi:hypothetical protein
MGLKGMDGTVAVRTAVGVEQQFRLEGRLAAAQYAPTTPHHTKVVARAHTDLFQYTHPHPTPGARWWRD